VRPLGSQIQCPKLASPHVHSPRAFIFGAGFVFRTLFDFERMSELQAKAREITNRLTSVNSIYEQRKAWSV
jgi:hypothetical protein